MRLADTATDMPRPMWNGASRDRDRDHDFEPWVLLISLMAIPSGKFSRLSSALEQLSHQLGKEDSLFAIKGPNEEDDRPLPYSKLFTRCRRLFVQRDLREIDEEEKVTSTALRSLVDSLKREWGFVKMFWWSSHFWSEPAGKDVESTAILISKIEAAEDEINNRLNVAREKNYALQRPRKLAHFICDALKKIEQVRPETEAVFDRFQSSKSIPLKTSWSFSNYYSLICFICSLEENLEVISSSVNFDPILVEQLYAFRKQVTSLRVFLSRVTRCYYSPYNRDGRIKVFLHHVASVSVHAAYYSCIYWFKQMNPKMALSAIVGILDLQQQIDPQDPQFLKLNLKFLKDIKLMTMFGGAKYKTIFFLDHLFGLEQGNARHHVGLTNLVGYVLHHQEESIEKDESREADIIAALREALPLQDDLFVGDSTRPSSYELYKTKLWFLEQKIWLLKIEIFLERQVSSSTIFLPDTEDLIKVLSEGLEKLRTSSCRDIPEEELENENQMLIAMAEVVAEVESLYQSFQARKMIESEVSILLSMMLLRILLSKAGVYLLELLTCKASSIAHRKDQIEALHKRLKLLSLIVKHHPVDVVKPILSRFEVVARGIISIYYTFLPDKLTEEMIQKSISSFSDLLDEVKIIETEFGEIYPQFPRSNIPMTDGLDFIGSLLEKLEDLLKHDPDSVGTVTNYVKEIISDLQCLKSLLMKVDSEHPKLKGIGKTVVDIAYKVEYVIDSIEVGNWQRCVDLYYLMEEIRLAKKMAIKLQEEKSGDDARVHNVALVSGQVISLGTQPTVDQVLASLSDPEEAIIDQITRGSSQQDTVPIVGTPRIGKTTLWEHFKKTDMFRLAS